MRTGVCGAGVMHIVGCQEVVFQAKARRHFYQLFVDVGQLWDVVFLQFNVESIFAKYIQVFAHELVGKLLVARCQRLRNFPRHAAGGGDDALAVLGHKMAVNAWFVVVPFQLGAAGDLQQVEIARLILGQQQHMEAVFV